MVFKIDGANTSLTEILLKIHDKYVSIDDFSFLGNTLRLGLYEKNWHKIKNIGKITIHPIEGFVFEDPERIGFYSINEIKFHNEGITIILNEQNSIELSCKSDLSTIEFCLADS